MSTQSLEHVASAKLLDGAVIALRKLTLADVADVVWLYETLSDDECYYRFFTAHPAHLQTSARLLTETVGHPIRPWRIWIQRAARRRQLLHRDRHTRACRGGGRRGSQRTPAWSRYGVASSARRDRKEQWCASSRRRGALGKPPHASGAFGDRLALHPTPRGFGATRRDRPWRGASTS